MLHQKFDLSKALPKLAPALVLAFTVAAVRPAVAEEDPAVSQTLTLAANVSLVSDYRFRGISMSDKDIALQGGFDLGTKSGFYVGTWGSSIDTFAGSELELDIYGGYGGELAELAYDVGVLAYTYPGSTGGTTYYEAYGSVSGAVDKFEWTAGAAYAFDQSSIGGDDNIYLYLNGVVPLSDSVSLDGHVAYEDGAFGDGKWDWTLGGSYAFDQFSIGLAYVDTNLDGLGSAGVMATLGASF